jgi:hypothetical protein
LDQEEWDEHPSLDDDYGLVKLLLIWVLRWGVIDGKIVHPAPGKPLARWSEERHCWRVADSASDLEDVSYFAPTQSFNDAWQIVELLEEQAKEDTGSEQRYQCFLDCIDEVWGTALLARRLAQGFNPWHICYALLDAFEI